MVFAGTTSKENLVEIIELKDHPWFVACQFHPEFKSKPDKAHPLFDHFIKAAVNTPSKGKTPLEGTHHDAAALGEDTQKIDHSHSYS